MAPRSLRDAWTGWVSAQDYDAHMAAIEQAQANAGLCQALFQRWPPLGRRVLIAGAGTGQMLDFAGGEFLANYQLVATDMNPAFLERLGERFRRAGLTGFRTAVDDLEDTALQGEFDAALVVLVLEHIDWKRGIASLVKLKARRCYLILQVNPAGMGGGITPGRAPPGSMRVFLEMRPGLVMPTVYCARPLRIAAITRGLRWPCMTAITKSGFSSGA